MKKSVKNSLFFKTIKLKNSGIIGGYANCSSTHTYYTEGGRDTMTQTYDDDGNMTRNYVTYC